MVIDGPPPEAPAPGIFVIPDLTGAGDGSDEHPFTGRLMDVLIPGVTGILHLHRCCLARAGILAHMYDDARYAGLLDAHVEHFPDLTKFFDARPDPERARLDYARARFATPLDLIDVGRDGLEVPGGIEALWAGTPTIDVSSNLATLAHHSPALGAALVWSTMHAACAPVESGPWSIVPVVAAARVDLDGSDLTPDEREKAIDDLARAIRRESRRLRLALEMDGRSPGDLYDGAGSGMIARKVTPEWPTTSTAREAEAAATREAESGGLLWWDAALAEHLATIGGPDGLGKTAAAEIRKQAAARWATFAQFAPEMPFPGWTPLRGDVWGGWFNPDASDVPGLFPWLRALARVLWHDEVLPALARERKFKAPALPYGHMQAIVSLPLLDLVVGPGDAADQVSVSTPHAPGLSFKIAETLWANRHNTLAMQAAPSYLARLAHVAELARVGGAHEWRDGPVRACVLAGPDGWGDGPVTVEIAGGLDVLCGLVGIPDHRDNRDAMRDALRFLHDLKITREGADGAERWSRLLYDVDLPKRGRQGPNGPRIKLILSSEMRPKHRHGQRLVPALTLPTMPDNVNRASWPALAALDGRAVLALTHQADQISAHGGVEIPWIAHGAALGLSERDVRVAVDAWTGDRWARTGGRWTLAPTTPELRGALDLLTDGAAVVETRRKGAAAAKKRRDRP